MTNRVLKFIQSNLTPEQAAAASRSNPSALFFNIGNGTIYLDGESFTGTPQQLAVAATNISLSEPNLEFQVEDAQTVAAVVTPSNTTEDIHFKIIDTSIASMELVNSSMVYVTAISIGTTYLVAWCGSIMASIPIIVTE